MAGTGAAIHLPFHSRRVTGGQMRAIAKELGLPTSASVEDLTQMVSGKLTEGGRELSNVQLVVREGGIQLEDASGTFMTVTLEQPAQFGREGSSVASDEEVTPVDGEEDADHVSRAVYEAVLNEKTTLEARVAELEEELQRQAKLEEELQRQKDRCAQLWKLNCDQLRAFEDELENKSNHSSESQELAPTPVQAAPRKYPDCEVRSRKGKAPPVEPFTGYPKSDINFNDWLPTLESAAKWNNWSEEELLLQLAGHLRGRAFREWNLMKEEDRKVYTTAVQVLRGRVDTGQQALAA